MVTPSGHARPFCNCCGSPKADIANALRSTQFAIRRFHWFRRHKSDSASLRLRVRNERRQQSASNHAGLSEIPSESRRHACGKYSRLHTRLLDLLISVKLFLVERDKDAYEQ
jgi:hypothetical protein